MRLRSLTTALVACAMLVICGVVKGDDADDCRNADLSLEATSSSATSACRRLADEGDAFAQYRLGQMYKLGRGVQRNYDEAVRWFRRAANQGDAAAQYSLGFMYESGRGVRRDLVRAYMWFDLASQSSDTPAHQRYAIQYRDSVASKMTRDQVEEAQRLAGEWKPEISP